MAKQTSTQTYRVSDEVDAELRRLAKVHGGVDRALRVLLQAHDSSVWRKIGNSLGEFPSSLDAIGPELSSGRGKASVETRQMRQKGDTKR